MDSELGLSFVHACLFGLGVSVLASIFDMESKIPEIQRQNSEKGWGVWMKEWIKQLTGTMTV